MKKWDKSYTYAIVTCLVLAVIFIVTDRLDKREFLFENSEEISQRLNEWMPEDAVWTEPHPVEGEILYYSMDCFHHNLFFSSYEGMEKMTRRFRKSDIRSAEEAGAIAVFYYDRAFCGEYVNGADAYRNDCTVFILDADTLEVLACETVDGNSPPHTTAGGDRYGSAPSYASCISMAESLVQQLCEP